MSPSLDQLVIVVLVILATLMDLVLRWTKKRTRNDESSVHHDETLAAEEAEAEPWESEWQQEEAPLPETSWSEAPPPEAPPPEAPPPEAPPPEAPGRAPAQPRTRMLPAGEIPRLRRRLLERPGDARRAIVLMAVLGPCRALDPASRDVISAVNRSG